MGGIVGVGRVFRRIGFFIGRVGFFEVEFVFV